ncbi:MAG: hypothetical protein JXA68_08945 [Ignavibacteriales bacterium]|nr:hypothetical protein [Ignavibacteriales bacterium]
MKIRFKIFIICSFLIFSKNINSQTFGFGCLGLSSFFGGYTFYSYTPDGLNSYISDLFENNIIDDKTEFGNAEGFLIGANFFRAHFSSMFFSAKGYYQFIFERHQYNNIPEHKIDINLNHWGFAFDFGIPIFDFADWKIIEGGIRFVNIKLTNSITIDSYETNGSRTGLYLGSGIIIHIIKDYISIEGTASYNFLKVDNLQDKNGSKILSSENIDFIKSGSLTSTFQLNIGFPL